ncbi:PEX12 [Candida oxycetoniae]|uniref:Methylthioribose-1-phosphate isomerase n=1 Tax=Candida oxycetoniae TaxID=497107 RepID=A0AAI9SVK6_9ASCO|nr:PEX12 [Candida oxycetoniae]KAI3403732.2 PEX12 [Candida oxycetoniae]
MEYYSSLDASQLDSERPTLFEIISANQLESLLSPSLRYILVHYASKYPRYLLKLNNYFDEINLVFRSFIEWYFLNYWQATFTENFYGLKRVNQTLLSQGNYNGSKLAQLVPSMIEETRKLTSLQKIVSIFEVSGVSFLSEKLNYCYEVWYTKYITNQLKTHESLSKKENIKIQIKRKFVEIYPYLQSGYRLANLITTLMYLSGASKSPTILTYLFKINFSRLSQYDYDKNEPKQDTKQNFGEKTNKVAPPTTIEYILNLLDTKVRHPSWKLTKLVLGTFFPVAIFTLKFLEWWNSSGFSSKLLKNQGNTLTFTLPPPLALTSALCQEKKLKQHQYNKKEKRKAYKSGKLCPLCKKEMTNPAIIETGYVFDYSCIYNYLEKSHIIVSKKKAEVRNEEEEEEEDSSISDIDEVGIDTKSEKTETVIDINKGGRCPITGRKLLGCKWNPLTNEWQIDGIREKMDSENSSLQAIKFDRDNITLEILDQLVLPYFTKYIPITSIDDAFQAVKSMQVRGAPAIAIVGAFSVVVDVHNSLKSKTSETKTVHDLKQSLDYLIKSRPTAVNLANALNDIEAILAKFSKTEPVTKEIYKLIYEYATKLYDDDLANNYKIGENGLNYMVESLKKENFKGPFSVITICNTGSLATSGHGTALGIIRSTYQHLNEVTSNEDFYLDHIYPCETRPYNQGAKLTTYELDYDEIPFTLICDNMVSSLIQTLSNGKEIHGKSSPVKFIIVGADRIVKNGDTANKIGTFQLAAIANFFNATENSNIKFIVAAPRTTIDLKTNSGAGIKIEERPHNELTTLVGPILNESEVGNKVTVGIATPGITVWNPAFDVTPHTLIDAIITEYPKAFIKNKKGEYNLSEYQK